MFHVKHFVFRLAASLLLRSFLSTRLEEIPQYGCTFFGQYAGLYIECMIEALILVNGIQRTQCARFRVGRTEHAAVDPSLVHKPGAHDARFQRHVHRAARKPPHAELGGSRLHGNELRMPCRILLRLADVACPRDHARLCEGSARCFVDRAVHNNGADGDLSHSRRTLRLLKRHAHVFFIIHKHHYMVSYQPIWRNGRVVEGGSLEFGTSAEYSFVPVAEGDRLIAKTNNAGMGNTTAVLLTTIRMAEGDTLSFDYFYSSETDYDYYYFKVNDVEYQKYADTNMTGFSSYTFTAPEAGLYHFEWSYVKDELTDGGSDCVKIDNVAFSGTGEPEEPQLSLIGITATANDVRIGERIEVSFDCAPVACGGTQVVHSGTIAVTTPAVMEELEHTVITGDILERIEAAGGHYEIEADIIYVDRFALIQGYYISFECEAGVEMTGNLLTVSADMPETWHGSLPAVNHAGIHSAEIFHHANGRDYEVPTVLTNCPFNILPAMGDVNLDGSVTIADALQVMRHAIEVLTLEGASLDAADMNGDGVIGLPDAILIARIAMGL